MAWWKLVGEMVVPLPMMCWPMVDVMWLQVMIGSRMVPRVAWWKLIGEMVVPSTEDVLAYGWRHVTPSDDGGKIWFHVRPGGGWLSRWWCPRQRRSWYMEGCEMTSGGVVQWTVAEGWSGEVDRWWWSWFGMVMEWYGMVWNGMEWWRMPAGCLDSWDMVRPHGRLLPPLIATTCNDKNMTKEYKKTNKNKPDQKVYSFS